MNIGHQGNPLQGGKKKIPSWNGTRKFYLQFCCVVVEEGFFFSSTWELKILAFMVVEDR